ncbi:phenoloxidase-activating factor 3-like isoform X2 [Malaya genurostris]|uniref:phenoloxidase-activating factor 3-like isoform X2 n=1 Tax=Malaya genurostris TaxID=325434 RepID=UPI0026F3EC74|nr:phenoloxidase-activating factor 3-like isoform X2 [Malaya genurostris]
MMRTPILLLISAMCVRFAVGQFKTCPNRQQCVEFSNCPTFKNYVGVSALKWPRSVQQQVRSRLCKTELRDRERVYSICCSPPKGQLPYQSTSPWDQTPSSNKPRGLALLNMSTCGKDSREKISFGKTAKVFEYPWMALLLDDGGQIRCGGTLIAESYVLTAAHCNRPPVTTVRLGENDITKPIDCINIDDEPDCADPPQNIEVAKFIKHPLHSTSKRRNDIALIRLAKPAKFGFSVRTICLPIGAMVRSPEPKEMIVSGWGFTEHGKTSNVLQYASLSLIPTSLCSNSLSQLSDAISLDDASQFCARGKNKVDNCAGDSGGPLQYHSRQSSTVQYGIVSFGVNSCGEQGAPGVYTKVSHYIDWIVQNLE